MDTIEELAKRAMDAATKTSETVSPVRWTDDLDLTTIKGRIGDATLARVEAIANSPLPAPEPCDDQHLGRCLRAMSASLPRRASDDVSGELMFEVYRRKLIGYPKGAVTYLFEQTIERCQWFPTVAECLAILAEWKRRDRHTHRREQACGIVRGEKQARFDEAMSALAGDRLSQDEIDALPLRWRKIASERCLLWWGDGDKFTPRKPR